MKHNVEYILYFHTFSILVCRRQAITVVQTKMIKKTTSKRGTLLMDSEHQKWNRNEVKNAVRKKKKNTDWTAGSQGFLLVSNEGWRRAGIEPGKQAGRQTGWVASTWNCGGHQSLRCCAVIRHPSGSSGLFELYVPLIIHLGCSALRQAHKDLIYSLAGNERTWRRWAGIRDG